MKFTSVHKKTRGMRRIARNLPAWGNMHKNLDMDALIQYKKEYVKIWISPFYRLYQRNKHQVGKKNPPYTFRKQVLYQLIEIYLKWQNRLDKLHEPYYLAIWLGDPEFMDSQVVAALNSEIDYYSKIFLENPEPKSFPYKDVHPALNQFT